MRFEDEDMRIMDDHYAQKWEDAWREREMLEEYHLPEEVRWRRKGLERLPSK